MTPLLTKNSVALALTVALVAFSAHTGLCDALNPQPLPPGPPDSFIIHVWYHPRLAVYGPDVRLLSADPLSPPGPGYARPRRLWSFHSLTAPRTHATLHLRLPASPPPRQIRS